MQLTHQPLIYLFNDLLNDELQQCVTDFIKLEVEAKDRYDTQALWVVDQQIGGLGAYAMPPDPIKNPFPRGIKRSLYRPLQYARSDIDICDVRMHARYVVQNSGMHLEAVCRVVLKDYNVFSNLRFNNTTLGRAVRKIKGANKIDLDTIASLEHFVEIYNFSKHEVNQDETRERLFNAYDAVTAYFCARILGVKLLRSIDFTDSRAYFPINNDRRKPIFS